MLMGLYSWVLWQFDQRYRMSVPRMSANGAVLVGHPMLPRAPHEPSTHLMGLCWCVLRQFDQAGAFIHIDKDTWCKVLPSTRKVDVRLPGKSQFWCQAVPSAEMCSGSEEGSYLRLVDFCITQL